MAGVWRTCPVRLHGKGEERSGPDLDNLYNVEDLGGDMVPLVTYGGDM